MKILSFILCFILYVTATAQTPIVFGELTSWTVTNYDGRISKRKSITYFDNQKSLEQVLYIVPAGATDTTELPKEKRETSINEKGQSVNKFHVNLGPTKPYAPKDMFTIYQIFPDRQCTSKIGVMLAGSNGKADIYILEDKNIDFGWQITSERKKISDFECIKAVSKPFRGRVYEAWFAPEIAISGGPWKLGGLPGLILEAEDQSGEVKFLLEKLTLNPTEKKVITNPYENLKLQKITWEEYKKKTKEQDNIAKKEAAAKGFMTVRHSVKSIEMVD